MKMFLSILFIVLITAGISFLLSFIYLIYLPFLRKKNVNVDKMLFSESEIHILTGSPEFNQENDYVNSDLSVSDGKHKKNFHFWEKCYKMFVRK